LTVKRNNYTWKGREVKQQGMKKRNYYKRNAELAFQEILKLYTGVDYYIILLQQNRECT
jgi:hypothetical protein